VRFSVDLIEGLVYGSIALVGIGLATLGVIFWNDVRHRRLW
jgi:hypothetical protein